MFPASETNQCYPKIGLPISAISQSLNFQNAVAKLITRIRKFHSTTPVLQNLHWLSIEIIKKNNVITSRNILQI